MDGPVVDGGGPTDSSPSLRAGPALDLANLKHFLTNIGSPRAAETLNSASKKILYHYTDLIGLTGIIRHDDLWLTNARFSNDDSEMTHGYAVARKVVEEQLKLTAPQDQDFLEELLRLLNPGTPDDVYICCFCEKDNLLSQWRAYGANGTGVSLEIEADRFSVATGADMPPQQLGLMSFWKVNYFQEKQKELLGDIINVGRGLNAADAKERARKTADAVRFFIPTFKNSDFHEEQEWRLIFTPGSKCEVRPEFRVSRQILVPYYSLRALMKKAGGQGFDKLPILQVLIGPSPRGLLNKESAKMLLATWLYNHVRVEASKTSYRGA